MTAVTALLGSVFENISRGSETTCCRCGEIFNDHFVANLLLNVVVEKF